MRILVLIGGILAALFVGAAVLLSVLVDPNKYKSDISAYVKQKTGRELVFEGDVRLAFFPRLGVKTGGIVLGNAPGFGEAPFARIGQATVSVKLLPLLLKRVEIGRISVDGLELNLMRNEQGLANWAGLTGEEQPQKDGAQKPADSGSSAPGELSLDGLRLQGAHITWDDRQSGKRYVLSGLGAEVKAIRPGRPFEFQAACALESRKPELAAKLELSGTASLDFAEQSHGLSNVSVKLNAAGKGVPGGKGEFTLNLAELKLDLKRQTAQGSGVSLGAYGAKANLQFQAANLKDGPDVTGRVDIPEFNGRELSAALTGKGPDTADAGAYQRITAQAEFKTGKGYVEVPALKASLDDAVVEGHLRSTGLEKKAYTFNLRIVGLDADRFLPAKRDGDKPAAEASKDGQAAAAEGAAKDELFPVQALRELRLDGKLTAERFKVKGLRFQTLTVPVTAQNGVLEVGQVDARLYEGLLKAGLRVDVQDAQPAVTLNLQVENVQAKPMLSDMHGKESQFAGVLSLDSVSPLVCQGNSAPALKRTLSGRVRFSVRDGVFPGVNLASVVAGAGSKVKNLAESAVGAGGSGSSEKATKFGSIDGTAVIVNGVVSVNDLDVKAPFLRAAGQGTVNLVSKDVDYTLKAKLAATSEGQGGVSSKDALGLVVPVRVTGPYDNPSYSTDILRSLGKGAVEAVGGVVQGIGNVLTGGSKKRIPSDSGTRKSGGVLDGVKKLF